MPTLNSAFRRRVFGLLLLMPAIYASEPRGAAAAEVRGTQDAAPAIALDIPVTHPQPAPSSMQKEWVGPHQLLASGEVDLASSTVTLPLYRGRMKSGETVWYILLDTDDRASADALGLNYAPKLTFADIGRAVRRARFDDQYTLVFDAGKVDFKPERKVVPGDAPNFFPPKAVQAGSIGDQDYTPLVKIENAGGHIYNAPVLAFDVSADRLNQFCKGRPDYSIVHDRVLSICPETGKVTLQLAAGFSAARPVLYISTDANEPAPAALEASTLTPRLGDIKVGPDVSAFSPLERIYVFVNGPTGKDHPARQGLNSALSDGRTPLNVLGSIPTVSNRYSPLWDINAAVWTDKAIQLGLRSRQTEEFAILGLVKQGWLTGPEGKQFGSVGFVVNCPVVYRLL